MREAQAILKSQSNRVVEKSRTMATVGERSVARLPSVFSSSKKIKLRYN